MFDFLVWALLNRCPSPIMYTIESVSKQIYNGNCIHAHKKARLVGPPTKKMLEIQITA